MYCPVLPSIVCMHTVQFALALLESQSGTLYESALRGSVSLKHNRALVAEINYKSLACSYTLD